MITDEMVNAADSVLSRVRAGIPDEIIRHAISAALSASPAGVVKPLEWCNGHPGTFILVAESVLGLYMAWEINGTGVWSLGSLPGKLVEGGIEAAKSAAFADYSARIMSAIEPAGVGVETPPPSTHVVGVRTVAELPMTEFADAAPQRDEFNGEQTILTYNDKVGVWDLAFFESGEEFPEKWFGDTHWIDITRMWPGVIAQVASFATTEGSTDD